MQFSLSWITFRLNRFTNLCLIDCNTVFWDFTHKQWGPDHIGRYYLPFFFKQADNKLSRGCKWSHWKLFGLQHFAMKTFKLRSYRLVYCIYCNKIEAYLAPCVLECKLPLKLTFLLASYSVYFDISFVKMPNNFTWNLLEKLSVWWLIGQLIEMCLFW